jgi:glycosyltransferase involved in cell wall biosynthesis
LVPQKNFSLFLKVASSVLRVHPGVIFVIAGTGPLESQLREEAATLGIAGHIRFLGHVTDRVGLYDALDTLMMTSDFEGTPMTLLEAMASGLPVVASAVDGIAEVCIHGKNALMVPPGDPEQFHESLRWLIEGKIFSQGLGAEGRRRILERYDIKSIARSVERVYEEVLESAL